MPGGHQFSLCPQPVLCGQLQAKLRKLAEGPYHFYWAQGDRRMRERNASLKPPSPPGVALGRNGSCLLAPGPRRPTNNKVQSLGPVTVTGGGDHLFLKKKKKDKKVAASYKHRDLCFKMLRRMICPGPAHQKQA